MHTDEQIITLGQWLSPAYPVGGFAYSHGLESLVETGAVTDTDSLLDWLGDVLRYGAGQSDARFLIAAWRADAQDVGAVDALCRAFAPSRERLQETGLQGAAFCEVTAAVWGFDLAGLTYPVALGRAAALEGLPPALTARLYLQAFVSNLVAAAQRLLPIGQTEGQRLIRALAPLISDITEQALAGSLDDLSGTAFLADIASMKHETQYSRIFRT
ncbi:urease accessory protein UreF [Profundibacter amoris]|uniref:Urease accessory protein UreF n=2 Tax=Profundibacter amoris TaxID=2171755 RepID=A0A347ULB8_9RHOB|nr:urease accessory protein UreF [Profundibacter amoris]